MFDPSVVISRHRQSAKSWRPARGHSRSTACFTSCRIIRHTWLVAARHATRRNSLPDQEFGKLDTTATITHPTRHNIIPTLTIGHFFGLCRLLMRHAEGLIPSRLVASKKLPIIHATRGTLAARMGCGAAGSFLRFRAVCAPHVRALGVGSLPGELN
jgi:hypothetical protein